MKIERIVYELWEVLGVLYILTGHFIGGIWGTIFIWYGGISIIIALIYQGMEYNERKEEKK